MIITTPYWLLFAVAIVLTCLTAGFDAQHLIIRFGAKRMCVLRNVIAAILLVVIIVLCWMNFPVTLTFIVAVMGGILIIDQLFFAHKRAANHYPRPLVVENAHSLFFVLLLVWVIRSFVIQPYRVPTGSLQPTIRPGDFLVVNQFSYGLRFPIFNLKLVATGEPKRGDIALFYLPPDPSLLLVKRVIGLPNDLITYKNKVLYINGQEMKQTELGRAMDDEPKTAFNPEEHIPVLLKQEDLAGVVHEIYVLPDKPGPFGDFSIRVPSGHYLMLGDNRDNSDDSRAWGFVPEKNLLGKAFGIFMSWDALNHRIRWERIGEKIR